MNTFVPALVGKYNDSKYYKTKTVKAKLTIK
jgi:hypothetical protein